jgi:hypothetical protein
VSRYGRSSKRHPLELGMDARGIPIYLAVDILPVLPTPSLLATEHLSGTDWRASVGNTDTDKSQFGEGGGRGLVGGVPVRRPVARFSFLMGGWVNECGTPSVWWWLAPQMI